MRDDKFVSSTMSMTNGDRRTVFIVMHSPEKRGHGLLEAVNQALKVCEANKHKLVAIRRMVKLQILGEMPGFGSFLVTSLKRTFLHSGAVPIVQIFQPKQLSILSQS